MHNNNNIIFFDGMCNMCNSFVNLIIVMDKKKKFLFSPISGKKGQEIVKLYELNNIIGVKDATGDLNRVDQTLKKLGKDFMQLTGNDDNALEFNTKGGVGAISVTANIAPKLCSKFQKLSVMNDKESISEAKKLDKILQPIHHSMFVESNPSPVKYAAKLLNLCEDDVRLPLVKVTNPTKEIIKKALKLAKLI